MKSRIEPYPFSKSKFEAARRQFDSHVAPSGQTQPSSTTFKASSEDVRTKIRQLVEESNREVDNASILFEKVKRLPANISQECAVALASSDDCPTAADGGVFSSKQLSSSSQPSPAMHSLGGEQVSLVHVSDSNTDPKKSVQFSQDHHHFCEQLDEKDDAHMKYNKKLIEYGKDGRDIEAVYAKYTPSANEPASSPAAASRARTTVKFRGEGIIYPEKHISNIIVNSDSRTEPTKYSDHDVRLESAERNVAELSDHCPMCMNEAYKQNPAFTGDFPDNNTNQLEPRPTANVTDSYFFEKSWYSLDSLDEYRERFFSEAIYFVIGLIAVIVVGLGFALYFG